MGGASSRRCFVYVTESTLFVSFIGLDTGWNVMVLSNEITPEDTPSGSRAERYGACGLLEVHGVCWLQKTASAVGGGVAEQPDVQPILAVDGDGDDSLVSIHQTLFA